ncbi:hypothetical protein EGCR1_16080 (plasmid) [Enterococcus gilvus]|uniref:hypothetical protein n=1 Tax=Enterococcus gilvus TaxID=160453 RepID=UPI000DF5D2E8|nr:hypothetical protein [Enterococcus gilvus]AXG40229.1 hypothetical protein EGCR1_16080 [Enterococcus gilvus]
MAIAVRVVNSDSYDQSKRGRDGKNSYLYDIDQPANPETGEIAPVGPGIVEPSEPIEWGGN